MSLNKVLLIGNLGSDPETRFLPGSGKPVASFRMATNRKFKVEGQLREETEWFSVVAFGRLAEICQEYLKKGKQVFVGGRQRTHSWVDAAGAKHFRTEVIVEELQMLGNRPNGNGASHTESLSEEEDADTGF